MLYAIARPVPRCPCARLRCYETLAYVRKYRRLGTCRVACSLFEQLGGGRGVGSPSYHDSIFISGDRGSISAMRVGVSIWIQCGINDTVYEKYDTVLSLIYPEVPRNPLILIKVLLSRTGHILQES